MNSAFLIFCPYVCCRAYHSWVSELFSRMCSADIIVSTWKVNSSCSCVHFPIVLQVSFPLMFAAIILILAFFKLVCTWPDQKCLNVSVWGTGKGNTALTVALSLLEFPMILGTNSGQTRIHRHMDRILDDEELED